MDPQPKALRPYVLLTTAFVLFGAIAGYAIFVQQRAVAPSEVALPDAAEIDAVVLRPMSPPASMDEAARRRLEDLIRDATTSEGGAAREALLSFGPAAVPTLLDALRRAASEPLAFTDAAARRRLIDCDRLLSKIRLAVTPGSPAEPYRRAPDETWCLRRVKSWFYWWDGYLANHPEFR